MNPITFFEPLLGQSLLYPGQNEIYRGQCVQSVMMWIKANGITPPIYPSAADYYTNGVSGYTKIPAGQPIKLGDIVVWRKDFPPSGGNGHIDVASADGSLSSFSAYDSNWYPPLKLAHILHTGNNNNYIAGYLRKEEDMITQAFEHELAKLSTGSYPGAGYNSAFVGTSNWDGMMAFWQGQSNKSDKAFEDTLAQMQTGSKPGKDYNYQFNGVPVGGAKLIVDFWSKQPKPATNLKTYDGPELFVKL